MVRVLFVCSFRDSGSVDIEKKVPDSITKWAAGAFCVSPVGLGVSRNIGLTAFQPFFVSLTLPYSVIRGEVFTLKATVFNYLSDCIMVNMNVLDLEFIQSDDVNSVNFPFEKRGDMQREGRNFLSTRLPAVCR